MLIHINLSIIINQCIKSINIIIKINHLGMSNWFEIIQIKDHIYVIRERLDLIDSRFHTKFTNIYLILGSESAILFDTGSGYSSIKSIINPIIRHRDLIVINSHNHFDHVGGNHEFQSAYVHIMDLRKLTSPLDVSFLKTSTSKVSKQFSKIDYSIKSSNEHQAMTGDETFHLGKINVTIISTPGHTPGSICLLTSNDELFTGDTIHYGSIYLPSDDDYNNYKHSLQSLQSLILENKITSVYPAHEDYEVKSTIIEELIEVLDNVDHYLPNASYDEFLQLNFFDTPKFRIIFPENYEFTTSAN